jgi:hypothetical protein
MPIEFPDFERKGMNKFESLAKVKDINCKLFDQRNVSGAILSADMLITAPLYKLSLTPAEKQTDIRELDAKQTFKSVSDSIFTRGKPNRYYDYVPTLIWGPVMQSKSV